jgi:RNA polymerase sigma-70 factor (ECF subfamily)
MIEGSMSQYSSQTDDELLGRLRNGEEEAFVALYRRRQGAIYRFATHMSGSASAAEDITQEVFLALLREQCGYDCDRGTLSGYLFGIARKLVLRGLERSRSEVPLESEADEVAPQQLAVIDDPLAGMTKHEATEALRRAVQALPRRYREVVVLCDLEEMDYAEAATVLGCPIGTVRSRMHRARALLLEKLHQDRKPRVAVDAWKPMRYAI